MKRRPHCKCGKIRVYYGTYAGYSVACKDCNLKNAERQRLARAAKATRTQKEDHHAVAE
jgi:hypothetical protein